MGADHDTPVIGHPRFRPIAAILAEQPVKAAYLDSKIAVLTSEGISNFEALPEALGRGEGRSGRGVSYAHGLSPTSFRDSHTSTAVTPPTTPLR